MADDSVAAALEWFKFAAQAEADQREREQDDLRFQTPEGAWPDEVRAARGAVTIEGIPIPARPMLSVANLDEPIMLVSSMARSAHLGVNIHALNEDATDDTAEVIQGLYRNIETTSHASIARNWAYDRTLWCGRGIYRVNKVSDPDGGHPLDQKLVIDRMLYQGNAYLDPFAEQPNWKDGKRAMVVADLPLRTYQKKYPKSRVAGLSDGELIGLGSEQPNWIGGDGPESRTVRIAEDWRVDIDYVPQVLLDNNDVVDADQIPQGRVKHPTDTRAVEDREERHVFWRVINCQEVIETELEWDGRYIALVPTIGRELQPINGKRIWFGMASTAKDAVRLTNYAASGAAEMAALEPKAPWMGVEGVFEGHTKEFQQSNIRNIPYLQFRPEDLQGRPAPPPQRVQVDVGRLGPNMQLLGMGKQFVESATFTYGPAKGEQTPAHRSGRAIVALQDQTVESTSPYLDNLANISMTLEAEIILDLIPHVYSRPGHVARILDENGTASTVMLNAPFMPHPQTGKPTALPYGTPEEQQATDRLVADKKHPAKHYDLSKGRYGVSITIGKSKNSRLSEGADEMSQILQADPALMPVIGPEYFRFRDFPGAQTIAKLLQKMRDHTMPWLSETQPQMDPQQVQQQMQTMQQQLQAMQQVIGKQQHVIESKQIETQGKVQISREKIAAEMSDADKDRTVKLYVAELEAKNERLQLLYEGLQATTDRAHDVGLAAGDHAAALAQGAQQQAHDAGMAAGDHQAATAQADQAHGQALAQNQQTADLATPPTSPQGDGSGD